MGAAHPRAAARAASSAATATDRAPPAAGTGGPSPSAAWRCVLVLGAGAGFAYVLSERLGNNVTRVQNAFGDLDEADRPRTDRRADVPARGYGQPIREHDRAGRRRSNGANSEGDVVMVAPRSRRTGRARPSCRSLATRLVEIPERTTDRMRDGVRLRRPEPADPDGGDAQRAADRPFRGDRLRRLPVDGRRGGWHRRRSRRPPSSLGRGQPPGRRQALALRPRAHRLPERRPCPAPAERALRAMLDEGGVRAAR